MIEPIPKRSLFFRIPLNPERLRQIRSMLSFFFAGCTVYLFYRDYPESSALLAFACAVMLMAILAIKNNLDMNEFLQRIEALERANKGLEGTEHR